MTTRASDASSPQGGRHDRHDRCDECELSEDDGADLTPRTIQGKDLKAWYTTAQNAIQEARRWKETSREKDVKDLETKVRCLEAVVRVSKGERDIARKQERRYKAEVERLNVAARDLLAVVREVAGLHRPRRTECLNPSHEADCEANICKTCDHIWPCPTGRALEALTEIEGDER